MGKEYDVGLGAILALLGMILLLVANFNRRAVRRRGASVSQILLARWGAVAAFCLLGLGLVFLLRR